MKKLCLIFYGMLTVCCFSLSASAKTVTDTLKYADGGMIIFQYDKSVKNNIATVRFQNVREILNSKQKERYKEQQKVKTIFFDRVGSFHRIQLEGKVEIRALTVSSGLNYEGFSEGYCILDQERHFSVELNSDTISEIKIPVYLAYYQKKDCYELFCDCGSLIIKVGEKKRGANVANANKTVVQQNEIISTVIEEDTGESGFSEYDDEALRRIKTIRTLLDYQKDYPFSEELMNEWEGLNNIKYKIKEPSILEKVEAVLADYRERDETLKKEHEETLKREQAEKEDSIAKAMTLQKEEELQKEKSSQKRTLWMIIGGVVLAVLAFFGNQILQNRRNAKNQRNIAEMQQEMTKRAENEAKRRAQAMARTKINQAKNDARRKSSEMIKDNMVSKGKNKIKNNKNFSI